MKIAFDSKRAFLNRTGLGNYSRNLIISFIENFPNNEYLLFTTRKNNLFNLNNYKNIKIITPKTVFEKFFPSFWRTYSINRDLLKLKPDIYHGLSNEIPFGIHTTKIKTVVTIHDIIFKKFPHFYNNIDAKIFDIKTKYAAKYADVIIATCNQTKNDIINFYNIDEKKIEVIYQNINPIFFKTTDLNEINEFKIKHKIPSEYLLYVGRIEERKNLKLIIKAISEYKIDIPLLVVGKKSKYFKKEILPLIEKNKIGNLIYFLNEVKVDKLALLYKGAKIFIYPSFYEGFGLPIIEAQASGVPVIASKIDTFLEIAQDSVYFIDPTNPTDLALAIKNLLVNKDLYISYIEKGRLNSYKFLKNQQANKIMEIYERITKC